MTRTEYTSNQRSSFQSVFKGKINYNQQNIESKTPSLFPSYLVPTPIIFTSNLSNTNFPFSERLNQFYNRNQDDELYKKSYLQIQNSKRYLSALEFQIPNQSREISLFKSKFSIYLGNSYGKNLILEPNNLILNYVESENEQEKEEPKKENLFKHKFEEKIKDNLNNNNLIKNNIIIKDNNNLNYNDNYTIEKNMNLNLNTTNNHNIGTKFFTNHNYGYKCCCSKTQCNRKYCECYNSGNYCIDCNCKNCKNQPPINTYSNKRPSEVVSNMKKAKKFVLVPKADAIKIIVSALKVGKNALLYVDVYHAKILKIVVN